MAGVIVLSRLDKDNTCEEQENRIISHVNRSLELHWDVPEELKKK